MPSYVDLGVIAVVLLSALLAMVRGFTREVLAIASWVAAAVAALYLYPTVAPLLKGYPYMDKPAVQQGAAAAIVFFGVLIVVSIITVKVSDLILDSKVGALDRSMGFLFGAARGFLLCVVAFMFFEWLVQGKEPEWAKNARTRPFLQQTGEQLRAMLPDDPESTLLRQLNKSKGQGPAEDPPAEDDSKPAEPAPAPQKRGEAPAQPAPTRAAAPARAPAPAPAAMAQSDRKGLDSIIARSQPAQR